MTVRGRLCPRCGRSEGDVEFIGPFCRDCYVEVYGVASLPGEAGFVYCKYCGRILYQGVWSEPTGTLEETLLDYLEVLLTRRLKPSQYLEEAWIEGVRLERRLEGAGSYNAYVRVRGRRGGVEVSEEKVVRVRVDETVCPTCMKRVTRRGYNAVIQVRGSEGRLTGAMRGRINDFLSANLSRRLSESIIGVEEHREGFDILVEDQSVAKMIATKLKSSFMARIIETYTLIGRNPDGSRKTRLTISVRVPEVSPGDVLLVENKPYLFITVARGGNILLLNLESGREEHLSVDLFWQKGFKHHPGGVQQRRYMLISRGRESMVFLDADSGYQSVVEVPASTVRLYVDDFAEGREYKVFLAGNLIYVIGVASDEGRRDW